MATKKESKKGVGHLFFVGLIEKFIDTMRGVLTEKLYDFLKKWILIIGHYGFYVAAALSIIFGIIMAIRSDSFITFATGIGYAIGFFVVQYVANKFSSAGDRLIETNPTRLGSAAFLDCFGLLSMIAGLGSFLFFTYIAIKSGPVWYLGMAVGFFVILELLALISFNPKLVTVKIAEKISAGNEAIGIITFFMKCVMKLIPILFGVGVAVFTIMMFINSFDLFSKEVITMSGAWISIKDGMRNVIGAGLLPFIGYIVFVLYFLLVDVIRSILVIPEKIDELKQ
jgi:hypothetical protein